jgi:hypothetical protein
LGAGFGAGFGADFFGAGLGAGFFGAGLGAGLGEDFSGESGISVSSSFFSDDIQK